MSFNPHSKFIIYSYSFMNHFTQYSCTPNCTLNTLYTLNIKYSKLFNQK